MAKRQTKIKEKIRISIDPKSRKVNRKIQKKPRPQRKGNVFSALSMGPYTKELACSIADPFSCSACIPDGRTNTGCFSIKDTGVLGTGAGGSCCGLIIVGDLNKQFMKDTLSTSATTTIAANWTTVSLATLFAQYNGYRPVSYGIRFNYIGNTNTDQGVICVGQVASGQIAVNMNNWSMSQLANGSSDYRQFPLRNGCQVTWRPESLEPLANWNSFTAATADGNASLPQMGQNMIYAYVFGCTAATAAVVQYEVVINFEGQFKQQNYIPGGLLSKSSIPKAEVGWYEKMKNVIDNVVPIIPLVGSALTAFGIPGASALNTLGALSNGIRYPSQVARSSLL